MANTTDTLVRNALGETLKYSRTADFYENELSKTKNEELFKTFIGVNYHDRPSFLGATKKVVHHPDFYRAGLDGLCVAILKVLEMLYDEKMFGEVESVNIINQGKVMVKIANSNIPTSENSTTAFLVLDSVRLKIARAIELSGARLSAKKDSRVANIIYSFGILAYLAIVYSFAKKYFLK